MEELMNFWLGSIADESGPVALTLSLNIAKARVGRKGRGAEIDLGQARRIRRGESPNRIAGDDWSVGSAEQIHAAIRKCLQSGTIESGRFAQEGSPRPSRNTEESEIGRSVLQVERHRIVADRVCRIEWLVRILVNASTIVIQRDREGVGHAGRIRTSRGTGFIAKLWHVDVANLE